jgi:hypothetical protein
MLDKNHLLRRFKGIFKSDYYQRKDERLIKNTHEEPVEYSGDYNELIGALRRMVERTGKKIS